MRRVLSAAERIVQDQRDRLEEAHERPVVEFRDGVEAPRVPALVASFPSRPRARHGKGTFNHLEWDTLAQVSPLSWRRRARNHA